MFAKFSHVVMPCCWYVRFTCIFILVLHVRVLPCDHEVTGLSLGNSLLQKYRESLRTKNPKWSDPSPDPTQEGTTCSGYPFCTLGCYIKVLTQTVETGNQCSSSPPFIAFNQSGEVSALN